MIRIIDNEQEHWALLQQEENPVTRIKLAIQGIEAFSHKDNTLLKKYAEEAYSLLNEESVSNIYRFRVGMAYYTAAVRENNIVLFRRFVGIFNRVLSEEKGWDRNYAYVYNIAVLCNNIGAFLEIPTAFQHSVFYLMQASNILNVAPQSSQDVKKSHKLILSTIGDTYTELKEFNLAHQYLTVAQKTVEQENYKDAIPLIKNRLGCLFCETQQHEEALACFNYVIENSCLGILKGLALEKKAYVLMQMKRWEEAQNYLQEALDCTKKFSFIVWQIRILKLLKQIYAACHQYLLYIEADTLQQQLYAEFLPFRHELYAFWSKLEALQPADKLVLPLVAVDDFALQQSPSSENIFAKTMLNVINTHYHDVNFGVDYLAQQMGISTRTLFRKAHEALNDSPLHFIRQVRLRAAVSLLSQGQNNISSIASRVGFRSAAYFTKIFREEYGIPPSEYLAEKR